MTVNTPSPSMRRLLQMPGIAVLTAETIEAFLAEGVTALFFTGNESRYAEITDLAVVMPELLKTFPGAFRLGVIDPDADQKLAMRFRVAARPTFLLLRGGEIILTLGRLQDWAVYLDKIATALNTTKEITA